LAVTFSSLQTERDGLPLFSAKPDRQISQSPASRPQPFGRLPKLAPAVPTYILSKGEDMEIRFDDLTEEQILAIKEFIKQVGGVENAQQAIESLEQLKKAA